MYLNISFLAGGQHTISANFTTPNGPYTLSKTVEIPEAVEFFFPVVYYERADRTNAPVRVGDLVRFYVSNAPPHINNNPPGFYGIYWFEWEVNGQQSAERSPSLMQYMVAGGLNVKCRLHYYSQASLWSYNIIMNPHTGYYRAPLDEDMQVDIDISELQQH